jgi:DNA-binding transcriptional ArsR family regulator
MPLPNGLAAWAADEGVSEKLERVRADATEIAEEISVQHGSRKLCYQPWLENPAKAADAYVRTLMDLHRCVVMDVYPGGRDAVTREAELMEVALGESDDVLALSDLHARVSVRAIVGPTGTREVSWVLPPVTGPGVIAVSSVVLRPTIASAMTVASNADVDDPPAQVDIVFAPPDLAVVDDTRRRTSSADPLDALIGHARAGIMRRLDRAATTTQLANQLGFAPSTVSQHLGKMIDADVVESHRHGRAVYYRLTDRGRTIIRMYMRTSNFS